MYDTRVPPARKGLGFAGGCCCRQGASTAAFGNGEAMGLTKVVWSVQLAAYKLAFISASCLIITT